MSSVFVFFRIFFSFSLSPPITETVVNLYVLYSHIQSPHHVLQFYMIFARPSVLEWLKFCQSVSLVVIEPEAAAADGHQPLHLNRCLSSEMFLKSHNPILCL